MKNIYLLLENLGFNENQAKTYCALLKMGRGTILDIAKHSRVNRTTIYDNIRALSRYGLISEIYEEGKKYFIAESPEFLKNIVKENERAISELIPRLSKFFKKGSKKVQIKFFEDKDGLKRAVGFSLAQNSGKKIRLIGDMVFLSKWMDERQNELFQKKRMKKKIRLEVLTTRKILKDKERYSIKENEKMLQEIRYLEGLKSFQNTIILFGNQVLFEIFSEKEKYVVALESRELAKTFDAFFEFFWKISSDINSMYKKDVGEMFLDNFAQRVEE